VELDPDALPESVQSLVEVIGLAATLKLVESHGGIRLWVPKRLEGAGGGQALIDLIGQRAAEQLVHVFGGDVLSVPRCVRAIRHQRDAEIRRRRAEGEPVARLAREHGLTERQVFSILASNGGQAAQGSLL
jgi:chemotaxis response regulator CheB